MKMQTFKNNTEKKNKMDKAGKKNTKKKVEDSSSDEDYDSDSDYETISDEEEDTSLDSDEEDDDEEEDSDEEDDDEEEDEDEEEDSDEEDDEDDDSEQSNNRKKSSRYKTRQKSKNDDDKSEKKLLKLLKKKAIEIAEEEEEKMYKKKSKNSKKEKKNKKKDKKKAKKSKKEEDEDEDDEDYDEEDDEYVDMNGGGGFILSIDGFGAINNDEADYNAMMKEDKNENCNSDDEETFMKESFKPVNIPDSPVNHSNNSSAKSTQKQKKKNTTRKDKKNKKDGKDNKDNKDDDEREEPSVEDKYAELVKVRQDLSEQLEKTPKNKILRNAIKECKKSIAELVKKERNKNTQKYYKLVHEDPKDKKNTNEMSFFKKKLSHKEQMRVMKDLKEINAFTNTDKPYRLALLESDIPPRFKAIAMQKLNVLKSMSPSDSEYYKMKNWVDGFMRVPYGIYKNLSVTLDDGKDKCNAYIKNAKETLDNCTYGLNDAKMQILQMVGQWISNPNAMGTAIAIKGPPGTGKTTLVKDGISKILGREFAFIALGGTGDASFLEGHSYTYEGSTWGKIVSILMDCKCMNPVIYFDELDKLSDTPKGEEIASILTHLTDTTQNSQFHDKYYSEVSFDLSKCLFIFSYNDETKVNPILKDRMYRIQTKGYESKEKIIIARKHLLPKIREQVNFKEEDVIIPDTTLDHIISNPSFCKEEQGVRNLKRCLEIIHTKLNLFRLVNKDEKMFEKDIKMDVSFPFTVEKRHADELIKSDEPMNQSMLAMYV